MKAIVQTALSVRILFASGRDGVATTGWPDYGEVDIMEKLGNSPAIAYGPLLSPGNLNAIIVFPQQMLVDSARGCCAAN